MQGTSRASPAVEDLLTQPRLGGKDLDRVQQAISLKVSDHTLMLDNPASARGAKPADASGCCWTPLGRKACKNLGLYDVTGQRGLRWVDAASNSLSFQCEHRVSGNFCSIQGLGQMIPFSVRESRTCWSTAPCGIARLTEEDCSQLIHGGQHPARRHKALQWQKTVCKQDWTTLALSCWLTHEVEYSKFF